jgi:hypothetical protein
MRNNKEEEQIYLKRLKIKWISMKYFLIIVWLHKQEVNGLKNKKYIIC